MTTNTFLGLWVSKFSFQVQDSRVFGGTVAEINSRTLPGPSWTTEGLVLDLAPPSNSRPAWWLAPSHPKLSTPARTTCLVVVSHGEVADWRRDSSESVPPVTPHRHHWSGRPCTPVTGKRYPRDLRDPDSQARLHSA